MLTNRFSRESPLFKAPKILEKLVHNKVREIARNVHFRTQLTPPRAALSIPPYQTCFDYAFYLRRNKDLLEQNTINASDEDTIWEHFVYHGQFEPRQFRCATSCPAVRISE